MLPVFPKSLPDLLCELIARPSVSPGADSAGTPTGERAMADYVAGLLRGLGAQVSLQEVQPGRPNVIGVFPAAVNRETTVDGGAERAHARCAPTVALVPHLDTVGVGGMTVDPFKAEVRDGRIYGRGACDTKGPMAAALWALAEWVRGGGPARSRVTWKFVATVDEEALSVGATVLCAKQGAEKFHADFAVVLEPTELRTVHASKGVLRVFVDAAGRACHASEPERGVNAIYRMRPFIEACETRLAREFAATKHELLGVASLNLGLISGGRSINIVPDVCRVALDMRTHPGLNNERALALVRAEASALELSMEIESAGESFVVPTDNVWLTRFAAHTDGVDVAPWFSDANVFNQHGISSVAFGPGSIKQAHTADEFIAISSLFSGSKMLESFISSTSTCG